MEDKLKNPDYDGDFLLNEVASQSPLFKQLLLSLIEDVESVGDIEEAAWLGTLKINGLESQIKLVVTQDSNNFVDETD